MLDAFGHKRSSRSTPTGPGSRGGSWHEPEFRAAWYRKYRKEHPAYREREARKRTERRKRRREQYRSAPLPTFTEAVRVVLREEVGKSSYGLVARLLALEPRAVWRWINGPEERAKELPTLEHPGKAHFAGCGHHRPGGTDIIGESIDAVVMTYGLRRIVGTYNRIRKEARAQRRRDARAVDQTSMSAESVTGASASEQG